MRLGDFSKCYAKYTFISGPFEEMFGHEIWWGHFKVHIVEFPVGRQGLAARELFTPGLFRRQKVPRSKDLCSVCLYIPQVWVEREEKKNVLFLPNLW